MPSTRVLPRLAAALTAAACLLSCSNLLPAATPTQITIDAKSRFQTFKGWEAEILVTVRDYTPYLGAMPTLLEMAANDLGITRVRLSIQSGTEHPPGYGQDYIDGRINEGTLIQQFAYNIVNDNDNPNVANLAGFDFALLDWRMDNMVMPLKRLLDARGEKLYLYLAYVDFGSSPFEHKDHPDEYAEFMLVMFDHLKSKYGVMPDGIDVMNEPDQTEWRALDVARAIAATGPRLAAAGYHPDFIVASTVDRAQAVPFFENVISQSGVKALVTDLSYHCYADSGSNSVQKIGDAARKYGVGVAMNECWTNENDLAAAQNHIKVGAGTSWQKGPLLGTSVGIYEVDRATQKVTLEAKTRLLRQYFRAIRPDAVRIDASTNDSSFDPIAFINPDGTVVVAIRAGAGVAEIQNLPAGTYDVSFTTDNELETHRPAATIANGESLSVTMPRSGSLTIVGTTPDPNAGGAGRQNPNPTQTGGKAVPRPR